MTTKTIKTILFASLIAVMILPFNGMNYVTAERPIGLEDATEEQLSEYNLVAPLLEELYFLDSEGRAFYAEKSTLTDADVKYLENTEIRIREIQATLGKLSADQRELYAMDMATEAKFMASQKAFVESGLEFSGVYVDQKTATLNIAVPEKLSDKAYEIKKQIEQIIDVPYVLKFADFHDAACSTQESNCDPIVGGIEINDNCSIGLPVIRNVFWWTEDGFITAGHCTSGGASVYQPNNSYTQDGTTTKWQNSGSCDCAFVDETGSASLNSAVWWSSSSSLSITTKSDPLVNDYVYMIGKTSGIKYGKVISVTYSGGSPTISDMILIDWFAAQGGDSGGAIISATSTNVFHGIVKGYVGGDTAGPKWSKIDAALDLQ